MCGKIFSLQDLPNLVHVRPSFSIGGAEMRTVQILNHLGDRYRHCIVALDGNFTAAQKLQSHVSAKMVEFRKTSNPLDMIHRLIRLFRSLHPSLLLTYNWGGIDGVAANAMARFCPLIHTEDGFGPDEAQRQKHRRVFVRNALLSTAYAVVAPSFRLFDLMRYTWRISPEKIRHIPNGVDVVAFTPGEPSAKQEIVIGTVGNLTGVRSAGAVAAGVFGSLPDVSGAVSHRRGGPGKGESGTGSQNPGGVCDNGVSGTSTGYARHLPANGHFRLKLSQRTNAAFRIGSDGLRPACGRHRCGRYPLHGQPGKCSVRRAPRGSFCPGAGANGIGCETAPAARLGESDVRLSRGSACRVCSAITTPSTSKPSSKLRARQ